MSDSLSLGAPSVASPAPCTSVDLKPTEEILRRHGAGEGAAPEARHLISVLQDVQLAYRYLPRSALERVASALGVPLAKVYSVATFYKAFSLTPRGEKLLRVCTGTACHIRGAPLILNEIRTRLGVSPGETTPDQEFSLEAVNCVGACALAPVVMVNDTAHGNLSVTKVRRLVKSKPAAGDGGPQRVHPAGGARPLEAAPTRKDGD